MSVLLSNSHEHHCLINRKAKTISHKNVIWLHSNVLIIISRFFKKQKEKKKINEKRIPKTFREAEQMSENICRKM